MGAGGRWVSGEGGEGNVGRLGCGRRAHRRQAEADGKAGRMPSSTEHVHNHSSGCAALTGTSGTAMKEAAHVSVRP